MIYTKKIEWRRIVIGGFWSGKKGYVLSVRNILSHFMGAENSIIWDVLAFNVNRKP